MFYRYLIVLATFVSFGLAILPQSINDMIVKDKIAPSNLSILIKDSSTNTTLASLNPEISRTPASVAKIATTYAALLEFGADFKWPTQIYYTGKLKSGILNGDIVVKAYGDPTLRAKDVKEFANKIASYGIRKITGNLVIDRSFFKNSTKISSGFDKNYVSEYNAMPDALMYNDHLSTIKITPTAKGVKAFTAYGDRGFKLVNKIKPVKAACRGKNSWPSVKFIKDNGVVDVYLSGNLSTRCRTITLNRVLSKPYVSFYYSFGSYLKKAGVQFGGSLVLNKTPKSAKLMFTHYSKTLLQVVAKTLKMSNNLYARHIFLILGAKRYGYPATEEKSQRAVKDILGSRGLLESSDHLVNGCGLSRESKLKVTSAVKIMDDAYKTFGDRWLQALSIAGVDGTINKRFKHTVVKNRAFMKTGTLKKAKNIAGFVRSKSGRLYNVAIFYNGSKIWLGRDIQNKIITWLVNGF